MCQCRFSYNKCTTVVWAISNREAMHILGQGVYGRTLPSTRFCVNRNYSKKQNLSKENDPCMQLLMFLSKTHQLTILPISGNWYSNLPVKPDEVTLDSSLYFTSARKILLAATSQQTQSQLLSLPLVPPP